MVAVGLVKINRENSEIMDEAGGCLIGGAIAIAAIMYVIWLVLYVAYVSALWLASFIDSYQIFFYGFSALLISFAGVWASKAMGIERHEQRQKEAYQLLRDSLANIKDTLSRNWKK